MSWRSQALDELRRLASTGDPFTSDDLIAAVGVPDDQHQPNGRNNAVGAVFRDASSAGWIVSEGRVVPSKQTHRKGGAVRVWKGKP